MRPNARRRSAASYLSWRGHSRPAISGQRSGRHYRPQDRSAQAVKAQPCLSRPSHVLPQAHRVSRKQIETISTCLEYKSQRALAVKDLELLAQHDVENFQTRTRRSSYHLKRSIRLLYRNVRIISIVQQRDGSGDSVEVILGRKRFKNTRH